MNIFSAGDLDELSAQAKASQRQRQHRNVHQSYQDACQRLFNAIEPDSYIRPHQHASDPREELLVAVRGLMALVTFDDEGNVLEVTRLGTETKGVGLAVGAEVRADTWHTVIALEPGCVLLEVKAGPFDSNQPKNLATWAAEEASPEAGAYLSRLKELVVRRSEDAL